MTRKQSKKLSTKDGIDRLDMSIKLFKKENLTGSVQQLKIIKNELQGIKDHTTLNNAFKVLQTSFVVGFNTTSHRIQCSDFFKKRINKTLKFNVSGLNNRSLDRAWAKLIDQRLQGRSILIQLDKILKRGAKTEQDKAISLSYLYLSTIDGIYGKNLKDIIIWDKLSKIQTVDFDELKKMNMTNIQEYFKEIPKSSCLFDGWIIDIRNAIGHSSFWYDEKKKKIIYEERRKSRKHEKTINEMYENLVKLSDVDLLVFYYNEIQVVNKIISDLK